MDMRILSVLLIIGVAGSFGAVESQSRTRRSTPVVAGRSPVELLSRFPRAERDVGPKVDESRNGDRPTTLAPGSSTAAQQGPTTTTSSTPKSTEQTPAPTSAASTSSSTSPGPAARSTSTTTKKPEAADSKSSTPSSGSNDASASLSPRSSFNDDDAPAADHGPSWGPQVTTSTANMNLPPMNSVPNGNGWASSGANAFASSSAGGYAGAGSFMPAWGGSPYVQGRSSFYEPQPAVDYSSSYVPAAGNGYFNPGPFPQDNILDTASFQRMLDQHFQYMQAQLEAQQRATFGSAHGLLLPRMWDATNSIGGGFPSGFPGPGFGSGPNTAPGGPQSAQSAISVGPRGGFQAGAINPVGPGIESRFAEEVPAPSGNSFGVFSSSSSSSRIGPDGKQISHKSSTTGVNDNGKITFRTVQD